MSTPEIRKNRVIEVKFVADEDVLQHISENAGFKVQKNKVPPILDVKRWMKETGSSSEEETQDIFEEQDYVSVLGMGVKGSLKNGSGAGGSEVFPFQTPKHSKMMAEMASELARKSGKDAKRDTLKKAEKRESCPQSSSKHSASSKGQVECKKNEFVSKTIYGLRKRITALNMCSESESDCSSSDSEKGSDDDCKESSAEQLHQQTPTIPQTTMTLTSNKPPVKKLKKDISSNLVEEYFEAHSSSKVVTSDRTLQKLQRGKLDQETLQSTLNKVPTAFAAEREELNRRHESLFCKWILQLHLGFNIVLYGLGSKKNLLENFRMSLLQDSVHMVVNGFFPSITVKSILNSITEEVLDHIGTFRSPQDQLDMIMKRFKEDPSLELYLLIHNLDSQMLRGDQSQHVLGQLSSLPRVYLMASVDHINAPLMWDQAKQSLYNWLWYETTTYSPYVEETSYENSILIKRSGALALSSLTHVLHSLTPNARGIFRLLVQYQLENKDNPSYPGIAFQDFYQQCREAFLVNSDLTLRAQLTEFRDHKLIRTKRGADGVEYLLIPIDTGTLVDFLQKDTEV
ncbi:origin recognition complex subunit 2 isoform X2 [Eublepharis macularius]|uniref:Origin recognition complex subunit 2 n=1 Tax=Eublepharis macularius TaxID=481883 RepID=A0AA97KND7_EUBMA|nr:origin recognition complex subunit 2 isoform X2 [Eublepharis macularius]